MNAKELREFNDATAASTKQLRMLQAVSRADYVVEELKTFYDVYNVKCKTSFLGANEYEVEKTIKELTERGFTVIKEQYVNTTSQYDDYWNNKGKLDYEIRW